MFAITLSQRAQVEIERRRGRRETYTEKLSRNAPDLKPFLADFYRNILFQRQADMQQELLQYPSTVQKFYIELVPAVLPTEDFWQRYYYRTGSIERVMAELQVRDDEARQARQAALDRLRSSVSTNVQNLLSTPLPSSTNTNAAAAISSMGPPQSPARTMQPDPMVYDSQEELDEEEQVEDFSPSPDDDDDASTSTSNDDESSTEPTSTVYDTAAKSEFAAVSDAAVLRQQALDVIAGVEDALASSSPATETVTEPSSIYDTAAQSEFVTVSHAAALRQQALRVIAGVEGALSKESLVAVPPQSKKQKTKPPPATTSKGTVQPSAALKPTPTVLPMREWKPPPASDSPDRATSTQTPPPITGLIQNVVPAVAAAASAKTPAVPTGTTTTTSSTFPTSASAGGGLFGMFPSEWSDTATAGKPLLKGNAFFASQEPPVPAAASPSSGTAATLAANTTTVDNSRSSGLFGMFQSDSSSLGEKTGKAAPGSTALGDELLAIQDLSRFPALDRTISRPTTTGTKAKNSSNSSRSGGLFGIFQSDSSSETATGKRAPESTYTPTVAVETDASYYVAMATTNADDAPKRSLGGKWSTLFGKSPVKSEDRSAKAVESEESVSTTQKVTSTATKVSSPVFSAEPKQTTRKGWLLGRKKKETDRSRAPNIDRTDDDKLKRLDPAPECQEPKTKSPAENTATLKMRYREVLVALLVVLLASAASVQLVEPGLIVDGLCAPVVPGWTFSQTNQIIVQAEAPWWALPTPLKEGAFHLVCGQNRQRTIVKWIEIKPTEFRLDLVEAPTAQVLKSRVLMSKKRLRSAQILAGTIVLEGSDEKVKTIQALWKKD